MHAFLTTSNSELIAGPDTLIISPDPSIGIDEVRQIQHFLSRKPTQGGPNTVVISQAHLLTPPAQHALLKTLEEPPPGALIYLVTSTPDSLLPTILSRVQIVPTHMSYSTDLSYATDLLKKLQSSAVGERLKILEEADFTRDSLLQFLSDLEHLIHQDLSLSPLYPLIPIARQYLKANVNLKLCLAHLAINL